LTNLLAGTLNLLPRVYVGGMLKHIDFLASNVPGIPVPFYLSGARVDGFYGFGPTIGAALNITLMSYCGTCFVGINIDTGAVPDPDALMDCMRSGFDEILAIAGQSGHVVLPNRAS
jgi:diacylglycerol O-acyltransferase